MATEREQIEFLRAELERVQRQLAETQKLNEQRNRELKNANLRIDELTDQNAELKAQLVAREAVVMTLGLLIQTTLEEMKNIPRDIPEAEKDILKRLFGRIRSDLADLSKPKGAALLKFLLSHGNESLEKLLKVTDAGARETLKAETEAKTAVAETNVSIQKAEKESSTVTSCAGAAVDNLSKAEGEKDPIVDELKGIFNARTPSNQPKSEPIRVIKPAEVTQGTSITNAGKKGKKDPNEPRKTAGRVVPKAKTEQQNTFEADARGNCPNCGSAEEQIQVGQMSDFLRYLQDAFNDCIKEGTFNVPVMYCTGCRKVYVDRPEDFPVPYSPAPGCQLSADIVIEFGNAVTSGMPLNRIETLFGVGSRQIASQMFARPLDAYVNEGIGKFLLKAHERVARTEKHIGADETKFRILENDGLPGSPHIMVRASVPFADKQFAIFSIMDGRRIEDIKQEFEGWDFMTITRDGYAGYEGAFADLGLSDRISTQVCLVHQRRKIIAALRLEDLKFAFDDKNAVKTAMDKFRKHDPQMLLLSMLKALSTVYAWEKECRVKPGETSEQHAARVLRIRQEHSAPQMAHVSKLMDELASKYAKQDKNGKWTACGQSVYSDPVVFWKNHEKELKYFLEDPYISPDNNATEQTIRCCALYKTSAFFKQTKNGAKAFCGWMSLRETAKLNGIKDPVKWMADFHRAFYRHAEQYVLTERYERLDHAKGEKLRTKIHKIEQRVADAFDFEPWLAWNYAARMNAGDKKSA